MNRTAFRVLIFLAVVSISGTLVLQLFWMKRAFDIRNQQFDRNVKSALLNINEALSELNDEMPSANAVEQISSNYFVVNLNNRLSAPALEELLRREFAERSIKDAFEYGIFDCSNRKMVYGEFVEVGRKDRQVESAFPDLDKDEYYFGVYFPNKSNTLVGQMGIWIYSSFLLLVVVLFFGLSLFLILKQKRLSEVQRDFINNMTHEFRTPLSTLAVAAEVLKTSEILSQPNRLQTYAEIVERETYRLQGQVDRVLQVSDASQQLALKREQVDLGSVIGEHMQRYQLANPDVEIQLRPNQKLPEITGDRLHLGNVVSNLIDNAIKYSEGAAWVEISWFVKDRQLILEFKDAGKGIAKEHLKMIFQKFYRAPTGNLHDVKGFGLGLYYCRFIVEGHRGKISAESEIGKGTKVILSLPIS